MIEPSLAGFLILVWTRNDTRGMRNWKSTGQPFGPAYARSFMAPDLTCLSMYCTTGSPFNEPDTPPFQHVGKSTNMTTPSNAGSAKLSQSYGQAESGVVNDGVAPHV